MARRRSSVRSSSKRVVEKIRSNAEHLVEHPEHAVPRCQGRCPLLCKFRRARYAVERRHGMIGDDDKLERWSRWGNKLGCAYATVLRVATSEEGALEYLQNVTTHEGKVPIAPWGKAPVLAHVGLQHRDERSLRLLSAIPFLSSGDAVYATEEGLVCSHDGTIPDDAVELLLDELPVERASPTLARCEHVPDEWTDATYIEIDWKSAGLRIRQCERCVEGNLLAKLQHHVVTKNIRDLVDVRVQLARLNDPEGGHAPDPEWTLPRTVLDAYAEGEMSDEAFIEEARRARRYAFEGLGEPMIAIDRSLYRPPFGQVLDRIDASETERSLLEAALEHVSQPIVLERGSAIELLEKLWPDHGEAAIEAVLGPAHTDLYDPSHAAEDLERLVEVVADRRASQRVEEMLPAYERLPPPVDLADEVARAHRRQGRSRVREILSDAPDEEHRAIALALVRALDLPSTAWTVDPRTEDMAEHLVPHAERLLEAEGDAYHEALQALLTATGSTADLERSG